MERGVFPTPDLLSSYNLPEYLGLSVACAKGDLTALETELD